MPRPTIPSRVTLPFADWPKGDRLAWTKAFEPRGVFDEAPSSRHLSEVSRKQYLQGYGRWLKYLSLSEPTMLLMPPADRPTLSRVEAWLESFAHLPPLSQWNEVSFLRSALLIVCADRDFHWLRTIVNKMRRNLPSGKAAAGKARDARWLYESGLAYMDQVSEEPEYRPLMGSSAYRDGLMVALLAACPFRRRTLAALTVTRHLRPIEDNYVITVFEDNLKGRGEFSFKLPPSLVPYFETYLTHHRPRLLQGGDHEALWVTYEGTPMNRNSIGRRMEKATPKILGERMSAHAFRASAATTFVENNPALSHLAPAILTHASDESTEDYYIVTDGRPAIKTYAGVLKSRMTALAQELSSEQDDS
jgi:integrase